jgi:hypothetical protein
VGVGIWFGVQHLGYHEFAELGRAAKRTVAQKQIILNNLAVRRATEELSSAEDFASLCNILESAFAANEFDSFDLAFRPATRDHARIPAPFTRNYDGTYRLEWRKKQAVPTDSRWQLSLLLNNPLLVPDATFKVYRGHVSRNLMFDINLLTNEFQTVLSDALPDALQRALGTSAEASILASVTAGSSMEPAIATQQQ